MSGRTGTSVLMILARALKVVYRPRWFWNKRRRLTCPGTLKGRLYNYVVGLYHRLLAWTSRLDKGRLDLLLLLLYLSTRRRMYRRWGDRRKQIQGQDDRRLADIIIRHSPLEPAIVLSRAIVLLARHVRPTVCFKSLRAPPYFLCGPGGP